MFGCGVFFGGFLAAGGKSKSGLGKSEAELIMHMCFIMPQGWLISTPKSPPSLLHLGGHIHTVHVNPLEVNLKGDTMKYCQRAN